MVWCGGGVVLLGRVWCVCGGQGEGRESLVPVSIGLSVRRQRECFCSEGSSVNIWRLSNKLWCAVCMGNVFRVNLHLSCAHRSLSFECRCVASTANTFRKSSVLGHCDSTVEGRGRSRMQVSAVTGE